MGRPVNQKVPEVEDTTVGYGGYRNLLTQASVVEPPPPKAFSKLPIGPNTSFELRPNTKEAIDGSDPLTRSLSPFIIQLELPLVFGIDGGFLNQASNKIGINNFDKANNQFDRFAFARSSVAQSSLGLYGMSEILGDPIAMVGASNKALGGASVDDVGSGSGRLGPPAIADVNVAKDVANQVTNILKTPPLVLLVNPNQLSLSLSKIQSYQDRTRYGYIFHTWGESQPKLSIQTKFGAFISEGRGVQWVSRQDSAAWQNLVSLFWVYKNNGYIFDVLGKSYANHFVGALSISYDNWIYYGHMESFGWTFEDSKMHGGMEISIDFTVSHMVDLAAPSYAVLPMISPNPSIEDNRYQPRPITGDYGFSTTSMGGDHRELFTGQKTKRPSAFVFEDSRSSERVVSQKDKK